jgi:hypothetical protein
VCTQKIEGLNIKNLTKLLCILEQKRSRHAKAKAFFSMMNRENLKGVWNAV